MVMDTIVADDSGRGYTLFIPEGVVGIVVAVGT